MKSKNSRNKYAEAENWIVIFFILRGNGQMELKNSGHQNNIKETLYYTLVLFSINMSYCGNMNYIKCTRNILSVITNLPKMLLTAKHETCKTQSLLLTLLNHLGYILRRHILGSTPEGLNQSLESMSWESAFTMLNIYLLPTLLAFWQEC